MTEELREISKDETTVATFKDGGFNYANENFFGLKLEMLLGNQPLCDRVIYIVEEVKEALEHDSI